ncbi:MAG: HAD family phosphatase [Bacteroidales bacterium]|nr:HAD family phosphatase [Bacteroidales bacterium]
MQPVKNIIFDFGGVIIPVDPMAYAGGMIELGCEDIAGLHEQFLRDQVYIRFEKGEMSPEEFRQLLRTGFNNPVTDAQLDHAWNLMLGEVPPHHVTFLEEIKSKYRTFLLSNTNKIHYDHYQAQFCKVYSYNSLDDLFEKAYYSFQLKLYKPDAAIFDYVLKDSGLIAVETLFIDDNKENVEAARRAGLQAIHLEQGIALAEIIT